MINDYKLIIVLTFFSLCINANSQIIIQGKVTDNFSLPIENVNVLVYDSEQNILVYDYSNNEGLFELTLKNSTSTNIVIVANDLGFKESKKNIEIVLEKNLYFVDFVLEETIESLEEVVLASSEKISTNGNTTTIITKPFVDETEQTIEDVLKKLPGIEVLDNGSVKAHGKFINKLLIDGEDLFANDYQIITKNLDAKVLENVQIFNKFQDNPVLKKVINSDAVALNLQLKDEFKNIWFGNVALGLGTQERYEITGSIGLLRKKIKFFYFGDYNNSGIKAADQLQGAVSSVNINRAYQEQQIEPEIEPIYSISKNENSFFKEGESTFNNAIMNSFGFVTKFAKKIEFRGTGSFARDSQNQIFYSKTFYNIEETPITLEENSNTNHINLIGKGELELKYKEGEKSYIKNLFVYKNQPEQYDNNSLINNTDNITQNLNKREYSIYNHLNYSYALNNKMVWHNYLHVGENENRQNTLIESPVLNNLTLSSEDSVVENVSEDLLKIYGVVSSLFSSFGKFEHRVEVGQELKIDSYKNSYIINSFEEKSTIDSLQNNVDFKQNKTLINTKLNYSLSKELKLFGALNLNNIGISFDGVNKKKWLLNNEFGFSLKKIKIGRFRVSYQKKYSSPEPELFLQNAQLKNYRAFIKGVDDIQFLNKNIYNFYYRWTNNLESQELSFRIKYEDSNMKYTYSNQVSEDLILSTYSLVRGGDQLKTTLNFTSYFEELKFSTNFRTTQNWSRLPIQVNSNEFKILRNYVSSYFFSGTTYFKLPVNFNFEIKINANQSQFNGIFANTNWQNSKLNIVYDMFPEWNLTIKNNFYRAEDEFNYFLGSTVDYQPKESSFTFQLKGHNLLGEKKFTSIIIDEYSTFSSSVQLLPAYVILSAKYRF